MGDVDYERFADIYGVWTATGGSTHVNQPFDVEGSLC